MVHSASSVEKGYAPNLVQLLITWAPFALGVAAIVFVSIAEPDVPHARAKFSIWLSIVMAAPALALFVRDYRRVAMTQTWRLYWTFGLAAYLVHLWYGFVVMFHGEAEAVVASQGLATASFNVLVTLLWMADVVLAWLRAEGKAVAILRAAAHGVFAIAAVLSTLLFARDGVSIALGLLVLVAIAAGYYLRLSAQTRG